MAKMGITYQCVVSMFQCFYYWIGNFIFIFHAFILVVALAYYFYGSDAKTTFTSCIFVVLWDKNFHRQLYMCIMTFLVFQSQDQNYDSIEIIFWITNFEPCFCTAPPSLKIINNLIHLWEIDHLGHICCSWSVRLYLLISIWLISLQKYDEMSMMQHWMRSQSYQNQLHQDCQKLQSAGYSWK